MHASAKCLAQASRARRSPSAPLFPGCLRPPPEIFAASAPVRHRPHLASYLCPGGDWTRGSAIQHVSIDKRMRCDLCTCLNMYATTRRSAVAVPRAARSPLFRPLANDAKLSHDVGTWQGTRESCEGRDATTDSNTDRGQTGTRRSENVLAHRTPCSRPGWRHHHSG